MNQPSVSPRSAPLLSALDSLLAAVSACRNLRAFALMGLTFIAAMLVMLLFGLLGRAAGIPMIAALGGLLAFITGVYGANAVGILLMREAQAQQCYIMEAVMQSLFSTHRLIMVALLEGLIVLAAVIVIALVLFICKIPVLGPLLFAFAYPVSAVLLGVLVFSLFYVMFPLAGPAVWSGSTTFQVLARLNMLARKRLLEVITQQIILFFIVAFVASIIFAMLMIGTAMATGLSASIVGFGGMGMAGLAAMMYGGEGGAYMVTGGIGGGLLFALASVVPALIATKGVCIVYLNTTQGLDFAQAEAELESGMAAVKAKAEEARERAQQMAEQQVKNMQVSAASTAGSASASPAPASSAAASAATAQAPISTCPSCHASVAADDIFCGECGHKLK